MNFFLEQSATPGPAFRYSLRSCLAFSVLLSAVIGAIFVAPDPVAILILLPFVFITPVWLFRRIVKQHDHPYTRAFLHGSFFFVPMISLQCLLACVLIALYGPSLSWFANTFRIAGFGMVFLAGGLGVYCFAFRWLSNSLGSKFVAFVLLTGLLGVASAVVLSYLAFT